MKLEQEFQDEWTKFQKNPAPENRQALMKKLQPTIETGMMRLIGMKDPVLFGKAQRMVAESLPRYDHRKSALKTFVWNQLQGMRRVAANQQSVVRIPDRIRFDNQKLTSAEQELRDELGREPTDQEIMRRTAFSKKRLALIRRRANSPMLGSMVADEQTGEINATPLINDFGARDMWREMVYTDLAPEDQTVMEMSLGMNGRRPSSSTEIAKKLKRSPAWVSQRLKYIQQILDSRWNLT